MRLRYSHRVQLHERPFTCHVCHAERANGVAVSARLGGVPPNTTQVVVSICAYCIGDAATTLLRNPGENSAVARSKAATDQLTKFRGQLDPLRLENKELRAKLGMPSQHEEKQAELRSERDAERKGAEGD